MGGLLSEGYLPIGMGSFERGLFLSLLRRSAFRCRGIPSKDVGGLPIYDIVGMQTPCEQNDKHK